MTEDYETTHYVDYHIAYVFAAAAHGAIGQIRKNTGVPYITHPARVAKMVAQYHPGDYNLIAAAYLHDVVEDTEVTNSMIESFFGEDVAMLVEQVTNTAKKEDGNRETRNAINRAHTALASPRAQSLKLADIFDNVSDYIDQDPGYAVKYIAEKKLVLPLLKRGDVRLFAKVEALLNAPVHMYTLDVAQAA